MELIRKDFKVAIKDSSGDSRTLWIVASTEDIDRDGDRILSSGWRLENFLRNPVVPWAHQYNEPPVAKAEEVRIQNQKLIMLIKFALAEEYSFADTVFRLYKGGYLNAFSVGFKPIRDEPVERSINGVRVKGRDFLEQELWEVSACTIPSNPNALTLAKQKGVGMACHCDRIWLEHEIREVAGELFRKRISEIVRRGIARLELDGMLSKHGIF